MGNQRCDWSVGSRAQDFNTIVEQLGGLFNKKTTPTPILEEMIRKGHQVKYDHVRSRLQAVRNKFLKSQNQQNQIELNQNHRSYSNDNDDNVSPFQSSITTPDFYPQFESSVCEGNIILGSGATNVQLDISDLLSSNFCKMSLDEGGQEIAPTGSLEMKMEQTSSQLGSYGIRIGSDLPSFDVNQLFSDSMVDMLRQEGEQPGLLEQQKYILPQKFTANSRQSSVFSEWVQLGATYESSQIPKQLRCQNAALFDGFVHQNTSCQDQQQVVFYPGQCQQFGRRNVLEPLKGGCSPEPNYFESVTRDSILLDNRAVTTGDPSLVQRWQY